MAMGMGIDQAGMHEQALGIDHRGTFRGGKPQAHFHDHPILDQDIGGGGAAHCRIGQAAATDEADALFLGGHCRVSSQEEVTDAALKGAAP